ncbi:MAG: hypothetical protein KGL41_00985 [Actinomycetales bacterium]|nr:hypothetical protein [Actinomycetales bacterium]
MKKFLFFVILLGVGYFAVSSLLNSFNAAKPTASPTVQPSSSSSESATSNPQPTQSQSPTVKQKAATVEIISADVDSGAMAISVVAHATNIAEDGGSCTLVYQSGATTKQLKVKAESNVNDTQCYPMTLSTVGLPKGAGLVSVVYDSVGYHGSSPATAVTIK